MLKFHRLLALAFGVLIVGNTATVQAEPALQIWLDGAAYDPTTETWVINSSSFDLWVIGNVGQFGTISSVRLVAAVLTSETGGGAGISLTSTTTTGLDDIPNLGDLGDPSAPIAPISNGLSADGAFPLQGDPPDPSDPLPAHGIYGAGVSFFEWGLDDFTLMDSPVGDYITEFPTSFPKMGQVNVYEVNITGFSSGVHFDATDTVYNTVGFTRTVFVPFSHDGHSFPFSNGSFEQIPEPSTLTLWSLGAVALAGFGWRRRRRVA